MEKDEIKEKIKILEEEKFILSMKDTWDDNDYRNDDIIYKKIKELKIMLGESE